MKKGIVILKMAVPFLYPFLPCLFSFKCAIMGEKTKKEVDKIQNEKKSRRFTDRADVSDASHLFK